MPPIRADTGPVGGGGGQLNKVRHYTSYLDPGSAINHVCDRVYLLESVALAANAAAALSSSRTLTASGGACSRFYPGAL